jgi:hypothetical protein
MKHVACAMFLAATMVSALPAWGAPQQVRLEEVTPHPAAAAGFGLAAAAINVFYFPVRFAITLVTAEVGGLTGWLTGGDTPSAHSVWGITDGQPYIEPAILEGRERLRFGS